MSDPKEQTSRKKEYYERPTVVSDYDASRFEGATGRWIRSVEERAVAELLVRATGSGTGCAIDAPTGTGRLIPLLRPHYRRIIASDISRTMLDCAARHRADDYLLADAAALPLPAGEADLVLSSRFIFHFEDPLPFFREASRLLRPGGHYLFDAYHWTPRTWIPGDQTWMGGRVYTHQPEGLLRRAASVGLQPVEIRGTFILTPFIYQFLPLAVVRLIESAGTALGGGRTKSYYLFRKA